MVNRTSGDRMAAAHVTIFRYMPPQNPSSPELQSTAVVNISQTKALCRPHGCRLKVAYPLPQPRLLLFLLEAEIAGMAECLAIDNAGVAAVGTGLVVVNCRIQRLGFLQALAANGGFQIETREKALTALGAF